jgi:hypothetical protein
LVQKPYWQGLVAQSAVVAQNALVTRPHAPLLQTSVVTQSAFAVQPLQTAPTQLPVEQSTSLVQ